MKEALCFVDETAVFPCLREFLKQAGVQNGPPLYFLRFYKFFRQNLTVLFSDVMIFL